MTQGILKSFAALGAIALVGLLGLTVWAAGGGSPGDGSGGDGSGGGLLHHLHQMGHHAHHGGGHEHAMAQLIDDLALSSEQREHFETFHRYLAAFGSPGHGSMTELHKELIARFDAGPLDSGELRSLVDDHLEEIRVVAHGMSDELVALVNSLDETQRQVLREHLESRHHAHGN